MNAPLQSGSRRAIILFAHGARDPAWSRPFAAVADRLFVLCPDTMIRLAYLEFMSPTLIAAGEEVASLGASQVTVVPMFLGAGGHVRRDLPALVDTLQQRFPDVQWRLVAAMGENTAVIDAMAREAARSQEAP